MFMIPRIETRLQGLLAARQAHRLLFGLKGLEKESLRLSAEGKIATTPHPSSLGSALTHPYITTDYSEALPELITPPFVDPGCTLDFLNDLHRFVHAHLQQGEFLLATSMPVGIDGDESIPIARYGTSNIGRMKHAYRQGLAYRYGRTMQAIAGVHFNYSVDESLWPTLAEVDGSRLPLRQYVDSAYFGLIRNVHRYGWLIIYLFGASPAVDKRFFRGRESLMEPFDPFDPDTLYHRHATSLRMSDIGYRIDSQPTLDIGCNSLEDYVTGLAHAINQPHPPYERIGIEQDGQYRQLNTHLLQIENEYYSSIRPKQITQSGEKPTVALRKRGVRYVELRSLDLSPFEPGGVSLSQLYFLELFMLLCLLAESPPMTREERMETEQNGLQAACCGRSGQKILRCQGQAVSLHSWALRLMNEMETIARVLDRGDPEKPCFSSLTEHLIYVLDPAQSPSSRMLTQMRENGQGFTEYALSLSRQHASHFQGSPLSQNKLAAFRQEARASRLAQQQIEARDILSFEEFLAHYFHQR